MKPLPKRAHGKEALVFRREVAGRLRILVSFLGEKTETAKLMGISKSGLSNWISLDDPNLPSVMPLIRLCEATGCTLDYIFRNDLSGVTTALAGKIREAQAEIDRKSGANVSRFTRKHPPAQRLAE